MAWSLYGLWNPCDTPIGTFTQVPGGVANDSPPDVICGHTVNTPEFTAEGRLRLREEWERYGPHAAAGTSYIDEVG